MRGTTRDLVALVKPRITVLSVATAAAGLALAPGAASGGLFAITLVATLFLVGSANTLNQYVERDVDGLMKRTRNRPLPAGRLAPPIALWFGLAQATVAIPALVLGANLLTGALGALALVLYVLVYTPMKRHSTWALIVGAVPGAMPPLLGWTAVTGRLDAGALAVFAVIFVWQIPHFLAISLFQRHEYAAAGMKVMPGVNGEAATRRTIVWGLVLQILVTLSLIPIGIGGIGYGIGAAIGGAFMLGWGLVGLRPATGDRWARGLFLVSVIYLPVLFGLMFV